MKTIGQQLRLFIVCSVFALVLGEITIMVTNRTTAPTASKVLAIVWGITATAGFIYCALKAKKVRSRYWMAVNICAALFVVIVAMILLWANHTLEKGF